MNKEVSALRSEHNVAALSDDPIRDVAAALTGQVEGAVFDELLHSLPEGAVAFWRV